MGKDKVDDSNKTVVTEEFVKSVGNKIRRRELGAQLKKQKKKEKRKRQDERKKVAEALGADAPPKLIPKTLDNQREHDETTVVNKIKDASGKEVGQEDVDEEVGWDIENDELADYFKKSYDPKVLITSADNPHSKTIAFIKELTRIIPNSAPFWRKNTSVKKMVKQVWSPMPLFFICLFKTGTTLLVVNGSVSCQLSKSLTGRERNEGVVGRNEGE